MGPKNQPGLLAMLAPSGIVDYMVLFYDRGTYTRGWNSWTSKKTEKKRFFCFFERMELSIRVAPLVDVNHMNATWHGG